MDCIVVLQKENDNLQEQIQVVDKQLQIRKDLKDKFEQLEAEEKILLAQSNVLIKTHSEIYRKLLNEEDWKYKYDKYDVLKEIWVFNDNLGNLSAFKANYESLKAEIKRLNDQNKTQQKEVEKLGKNLSNEQELEEKNNVIKAENEALSQKPLFRSSITH